MSPAQAADVRAGRIGGKSPPWLRFVIGLSAAGLAYMGANALFGGGAETDTTQRDESGQ